MSVRKSKVCIKNIIITNVLVIWNYEVLNTDMLLAIRSYQRLSIIAINSDFVINCIMVTVFKSKTYFYKATSSIEPQGLKCGC